MLKFGDLLWPLMVLLAIEHGHYVNGSNLTSVYVLDVGKPNDLCPTANKNCPDGKLHHLCRQGPPDQKPGCNLRIIPLDASLRKSFLNGHNGIRNKVAMDWGISNMNLVYWSEFLEHMANSYLRQCSIAKDPCNLIGEKNVKVNSNWIFRKRVLKRWAGRVIRSWYLELGSAVHTFAEFEKMRKIRKMENFTQLIWPGLEFVGCGAARAYRGQMIACYYYPPFKKNPDKFHAGVRIGRPCTVCKRGRKVCSRTFSGLCGVEIRSNSPTARIPDNIVYAILIVMAMAMPLRMIIMFN